MAFLKLHQLSRILEIDDFQKFAKYFKNKNLRIQIDDVEFLSTFVIFQ